MPIGLVLSDTFLSVIDEGATTLKFILEDVALADQKKSYELELY